MDRLLCTKKESSGSLGISARALDYLIQRGALKPIRFGRRVMLKRKDIETLAQRGFNGKLNCKSAEKEMAHA